MESIVNESNRLLFQAFVSIAKQYSVIGEEYRSKALEKSSKVIANYPDEITRASQLIGFPGIGAGSLRRITEFLRTGEIKIQDQEYTRAAKKVCRPQSEPVAPVVPPVVDVLIPGTSKYKTIIIYKNEYQVVKETEGYYIFTN
jgi:DNA polymerase/3'-5' exonuclease PolX